MSEIHVCALSQIDSVCTSANASHLISVVSADTAVTRPVAIAPDDHLYLSFNDIVVPAAGLTAPGTEHVQRLIDFVLSWNQRAPIVIHCWAGVSRSTAAAFIASCALNPATNEQTIADLLRARSPRATPNARMVSLADEILGRDGRMARALALIGRGAYAYEGDIFALPARLHPQ